MKKAEIRALLARIEAKEARQKKPPRSGTKKPVKVKPKTVSIHLRMAHRINGIPYGPGQVWVPEAIAAVLRENDARALEGERLLFIQQAHLIELTGSSPRVRSVPPTLFDELMSGALPLAISEEA